MDASANLRFSIPVRKVTAERFRLYPQDLPGRRTIGRTLAENPEHRLLDGRLELDRAGKNPSARFGMIVELTGEIWPDAKQGSFVGFGHEAQTSVRSRW